MPSILTPCFPRYPSNHASAGNGAAEILRRVCGEGGHAITMAISAVPGVTLHDTRFKQITDDISNARVYGGIHFRFDQDSGADLGRDIGMFVYKHNLRNAKHSDHDDKGEHDADDNGRSKAAAQQIGNSVKAMIGYDGGSRSTKCLVEQVSHVVSSVHRDKSPTHSLFVLGGILTEPFLEIGWCVEGTLTELVRDHGPDTNTRARRPEGSPPTRKRHYEVGGPP